MKTVKIRLFSIALVFTIFISTLTSVFFLSPIIMIGKANPGNISNIWDNSTTLNVTVLEIPPRINWYDFQYNQSGTWVSKLNAQIDVNSSAKYRFVVDISSDQGWDDIDYVNITAWYDQGSESSTYNQTLGGNLNLNFQYENTTGTAVWRLAWPIGGEVTEGTYSDLVSFDLYGSPGNTECHNLTFPFTPSYQFRYAPGDGSWDNTYNTTDDAGSWNFIITVTDSGEGALQPSTVWISDEFGIYSYSEIVSAGWPTILGNPGTTAIANSNITIETRSNGNYSLSVDLDQLDHTTRPATNMANTTVSLRGGNLTAITPFPGTGPLYLWGTDAPSYQTAENNGTIKTVNDLEYRIDIPLAQYPGDYTATIYYHLTTQI